MRSSFKSVLGILIVLALGLIVWSVLTMPDNRTTGQRIGDAVDTAPQGLDKAARQLEDRTPGERIGDSVKDAGEAIKDNTAE